MEVLTASGRIEFERPMNSKPVLSFSVRSPHGDRERTLLSAERYLNTHFGVLLIEPQARDATRSPLFLGCPSFCLPLGV